MDNIPTKFWILILIVGILFSVLNLLSLATLYENISGDSIPNRPQKQPPIEYQWDVAITRIVLAILSLGISIYSFQKIQSNR